MSGNLEILWDLFVLLGLLDFIDESLLMTTLNQDKAFLARFGPHEN